MSPPGLKQLLSEETRHQLRNALDRTLEWADMARVWSWEASRTEGKTFDVLYLGRQGERHNAVSLLLPELEPTRFGWAAVKATGCPTVLVSEAPVPGALRVPGHLTCLISLRQPMEAILARFDPELRRRIRRGCEQGYGLRQVREDQEVERLYREMLQRYAEARHGAQAYPLSLETVRRMARQGRLDALQKGDEIVGVQLSYTYAWRGTRRFRGARLGFPEHIYSDPRRLGEANAVMYYFICKLAHEAGYDYFDMGTALARPDGRLLQFKRQFRPVLEAAEPSLGYSVLVPRPEAARVLAQAPLFAREPCGLVLHAGIEASASDQEVLARFHARTWAGISAVRLWSERPLDRRLMEAIRALYKPHQAAPEIGAVALAAA